jgi:WD repeat and SOF domain-containing protein 1
MQPNYQLNNQYSDLQLRPREHRALAYAEKLKEQYGGHPEIARIARHRHVPKSIYSAAREHRTIRESQARKEMNRRMHSAPGSVPFVSRREEHVIKEES